MHKAILIKALFTIFALCDGWSTSLSLDAPEIHYHNQHGSGSYQYAYTGPHHAKTETTLNGITRGGYSYVDANGVLQTVAYTADAKNGFRVHASNLPQSPKNSLLAVQDTLEVALAKRRHLDELRRAELQNQPVSAHIPLTGPYQLLLHSENYSGDVDPTPKNELDMLRTADRRQDVKHLFLPLPEKARIILNSKLDQIKRNKVTVRRNEPLTKKPSTLIDRMKIQEPLVVLPIVPYKFLHGSLRHVQDSLGQYEYSYAGDTSAKTEFRSLDGTTRGAYSYIDANGQLQQVYYIADHDGFHVSATNLPEAK